MEKLNRKELLLLLLLYFEKSENNLN